MSDQHITAIATIVQDVLLLLSAALVTWYLWETHKMRKATEAQVSKSQSLVEAAQHQVEAQIRPAVAVYDDPNWQRYNVRNVGSGPAIDLKFVVTVAGATIQWDAGPTVATGLNGSALPVGPFEGAQVPRVGGAEKELQIMYKSLSGREYVSVVRFGFNGGPTTMSVSARK